MASRKEEIRKEIKKKNEKEGLNPEAVNNIVDLQDQTGEDIKVEDFQGVYDGNVIPFSTTPHSTKKSLIGKIKGIFDISFATNDFQDSLWNTAKQFFSAIY